MKRIDLITVAGQAYHASFIERGYLLRLAAIPILAKLVFYFLASQYTSNEDVLSRSLFLLPAYLLEGWMLSHWARTLLTDHRWPFTPTGDQAKDLIVIKKRATGVMAGTVSFALINMLMAGFYALIFTVMPMDMSEPMDAENADPRLGLFGLGILIAMIFFFRFVWLYIPLSLNMSLKSYIKQTNGIKFTMGIFGVWLVCFIPTIFLLQFIYGFFYSIDNSADLAEPYDTVYLVIRVIFDTLKNIIVTAGIAYALKSYLPWKTN